MPKCNRERTVKIEQKVLEYRFLSICFALTPEVFAALNRPNTVLPSEIRSFIIIYKALKAFPGSPENSSGWALP